LEFFSSFLVKMNDLLFSIVFSSLFTKALKLTRLFRVEGRLGQVDWNFYRTAKYFSSRPNSAINSYFLGLKFLWVGVRFWIVGVFMLSLSFFYFLQLKGLVFNKTVFGYFLVGMFFYWLISGFVFFIKKYQYSKFTTVIQRFWKRTFIIFWMIEGSLFICFFYLVLNAPEEPLYMYDQIRIYKTHFFSWRWFLVKLIPSILLIVLGFYLQLLVKWGLFSRQNLVLFLITLLIVYIFWVEFYQFFHVISYYGNFFLSLWLRWIYLVSRIRW
jgi:hypothetical protein